MFLTREQDAASTNNIYTEVKEICCGVHKGL